jgi:hypothetical protein
LFDYEKKKDNKVQGSRENREVQSKSLIVMEDDTIDIREVQKRKDSKLYNIGMRLKALEETIVREAPVWEKKIESGIHNVEERAKVTAIRSKEAYVRAKEEYDKLAKEYEEYKLKHQPRKIEALTGERPTHVIESKTPSPFARAETKSPFALTTQSDAFKVFSDNNAFAVFSQPVSWGSTKQEVFSKNYVDENGKLKLFRKEGESV